MKPIFKITKQMRDTTKFSCEKEPKFYSWLRLGFVTAGLTVIITAILYFIFGKTPMEQNLHSKGYVYGLVSGLVLIMLLTTMIRPGTRVFWLAMLLLMLPFVGPIVAIGVFILLPFLLACNYIRLRKSQPLKTNKDLPTYFKIKK